MHRRGEGTPRRPKVRIPYGDGSGSLGKIYPDLLVFHRDEDGVLRASIVDPHGHHLSDAGPKLRGLAAYAEKHGGEYHRIIGVIKAGGGEYRMLDLKDPTVRKALVSVSVSTKDEIEDVFARHGATYA